MAASMRSLDSSTALSASPTMVNERNPFETSTSISTNLASSPAIAAEKTLLGIYLLQFMHNCASGDTCSLSVLIQGCVPGLTNYHIPPLHRLFLPYRNLHC